MGNIIMRKRTIRIGEKPYCKTCEKEIEIYHHNETITLPYCGECGKIVYDLDQNFCCYCGIKFENIKYEVENGQ